MNKKLILVLLGMGILFSGTAHAQRWSISTNMVEYLNLGTFNAETSYSIARKWSLNAGVRYNPFQYNRHAAGKEFQNKVRSCFLGTRFWPWHVYSGWWFSFHLQLQEYNRARIFSEEIREGNRYGGGIGFGYSYMIGKHFNVDFGIRCWTGWDQYRKFSCIHCGLTTEMGNTFFVLPDELLLAFTYVF